ncbi:uncharacterized protein [Henckelia pumila]|uniref:uncharacterized protein n=1 Tax=Henckelia pumila TaxID=405737 RepID=UPI003C6E070D
MPGQHPSTISSLAASNSATAGSGAAHRDRPVSLSVGVVPNALLWVACLRVFTEAQLDYVNTLYPVSPCEFCATLKFPYELPTFFCDRGKIRLAPPTAPMVLINLFADPASPMAIAFRRKIRLYNSIFSFTSFGIRIDKSLASLNRGVYTFRASGQVFHSLPPLVPEEGKPKYFQLYFWDNDNELRNRMSVVNTEVVDEATMILLMDIMKHNPYAKLLRRINDCTSIRDVRLHIIKNVLVDQWCYNSPSADQVAAIWVEGNDNTNIPYDRDIIVRGNHGDSRSSFIARNVLLSQGVSTFDQIVASESHVVRGKNDRMVSCREYYCYRLQIRENAPSLLLYGGRLLQQYVVDMYIKLETTRLDYYRRNQAEIRSKLYQGIVDSVVGGETRGGEVGHRMVLPSSFIGGPRDMRRRYLDAMALVRNFGKPDLFITMTCNPEWPEIKNHLFPGQTSHDRPDLVSRVFRAKLVDLKNQIIKENFFGSVIAYVYVIEFQKRGLPHCHFLLILDSEFKIASADVYDRYVSAELPNKVLFPHLFNLVSRHMMHGPCGRLNRSCPCMVNGRCKHHYPHPHLAHTIQGHDGYPIYRRRENGFFVEVRGCPLNSQWVVPYNPYLLYRYDCHINVETTICIHGEFKPMISTDFPALLHEAEMVTQETQKWKNSTCGQGKRFGSLMEDAGSDRNRAWNKRKQGKSIGRVNAANPIEGERYYLRLLLLHVRGPTSYDNLLTVGASRCSTFKESAQLRGLLECDKSSFQCLNEAIDF